MKEEEPTKKELERAEKIISLKILKGLTITERNDLLSITSAEALAKLAASGPHSEDAEIILLERMEKWNIIALAKTAAGEKPSILTTFAFKALVRKMRKLSTTELNKITTEKTERPIILNAALNAKVQIATINNLRSQLGLDAFP